MEKNLNMSRLLDFYAPMLTDKQQDATSLYYHEDLSLSEIAEHEKISRQGVRDSIKRAEAVMLELEQKLQFAKRIDIMLNHIEKINELAQEIYDINFKHKFSAKIDSNLKEMHQEFEQLINDITERIE